MGRNCSIGAAEFPGSSFDPKKTQERMQTNKAIDIDGNCGECCCSVCRNNGGKPHTSGEK